MLERYRAESHGDLVDLLPLIGPASSCGEYFEVYGPCAFLTLYRYEINLQRQAFDLENRFLSSLLSLLLRGV